VNRSQTARNPASAKEDSRKALDELFEQPPKPIGAIVANKLDDLQQQIDALQKQRDALLNKERSAAIEDINQRIKTFGIRVRDLTFVGPGRGTSSRSKPAAKYKMGSNLWSGRGRKPKWVEEHLAKGKTLDDLLIK
jgi:DNA-binding protein H-NS